MTKLSRAARETLKAAGIDPADWIRRDGSWSAPSTSDQQWHGDECGCTDDRCIGYHHDADEECGCLPTLIGSYQRDQQAEKIWDTYRQAVANDDQDAYQDAWDQAEVWVRRHYPRAESFSLDTMVNGQAGISITVHLAREPVAVPAIAKISDGQYRQLIWLANENPWDTWSRRDVHLDDHRGVNDQ